MEYKLPTAGGPAGESPPRTGSFAQTVFSYSIVALFFVLCGWYVYAHRQDFHFLFGVSFWEMALSALLILIAFLISAYQSGLFLESFGLSLGFVELTAVTMGMCLGNLILPMRGGTGGLAIYLKKVHGLNFREFAVMYGGTALLIALINAGLALIGLIVLYWSAGFFHTALSLFVAALFAVSLYLSIFPPPARWKGSGFRGAVARSIHSWHSLTRNRRVLAKLAVSFLLVAVALTGSFYFIYRSLGAPLSALAVLITSSLGNIANLFAITPGSLGIFDAVVIEIPQSFGLDPARSIAAALVFRLLSFLCAAALGIPGLVWLVRAAAQGGSGEEEEP